MTETAGAAKVLVVEDEGLTALYLRSRLEDYGYAAPDIADAADDEVRPQIEMGADEAARGEPTTQTRVLNARGAEQSPVRSHRGRSRRPWRMPRERAKRRSSSSVKRRTTAARQRRQDGISRYSQLSRTI